MQPRSSIYSNLVSNFYQPDEELALLDLSMPDDKLIQMVKNSLDNSRTHWNDAPWNLEEIDRRAFPYIFNQRAKPSLYKIPEDDYSDNRLFRAHRSIKAYVTSRLAMPELQPGKTDAYNKRQARMIALALYQLALDDDVDEKLGAMFTNHYFRKRGWLKPRFDSMLGANGMITTDHVPPEDVIIDKSSMYKSNPPRIHQRVRTTIDALCAEYPDKANQIYALYGIKQGRFTQISREVTKYETWFTYWDKDRYQREGVCWWLSDPGPLMLDKMPNPNWIYTGDDVRDRQINLLSRPPKPFIGMNYLNLGHYAIDETCVFEHVVPQQVLLDGRQKQWHKGTDYANGRWLANKKMLSEGEAAKMVNKGAKTIGMVDVPDGKNLTDALAAVAPPALAGEVYQSIVDTRNEVDDLSGTNAIQKGSSPQGKDTLGRDLLQNQQASSLQDDYVRAVAKTTKQYYEIVLQLAKVNWTEDQTIQTKDAGKDIILTLSGDMIDEKMKVGVNIDSIFPVNKAQKRQDAKDLYVGGKLDPLTAFEDMGYEDADIRAERAMKFATDPAGYQFSIEMGIDNNDAEEDIQAVLKGKEPQDRDTYDEDYLNYYNLFMTTNRYALLEDEQKQAIAAHLMIVQHIAQTQMGLQQAMLDEAGMVEPPPVQPGLAGTMAGQSGQPPQGGSAPVAGGPASVPNPLPAQVV